MTDTTDEFRTEIRQWIAENAPRDWRAASTHDAFVASQRDWFQKLVNAGYAVPHWPGEWPGGGRSLAVQKVIYEELAKADTPRLLLSFVSTYHAAATLMESASKEQADYYLPRILEGETWCQGFSEPNAGSDLAAIRTKAERQTRDGRDVYVVSGQKIWSTMAQYADMKLPGVTVRPIHQIQGDEEFAEIFLDEVEIPVSQRVGEEGAGWAVAQATLASERGLTLMELSYRMRGAMRLLIDEIAETPVAEDRGVLRDLGQLATRVEAVSAVSDRFLQKRMDDDERIGDASIVKLAYSRCLRAWADLGVTLSGLKGQMKTPITFGDLNSGNWMADFMNSYAWTIAGGSDEIQRNIIAERMLGMPREPKSWTLEAAK